MWVLIPLLYVWGCAADELFFNAQDYRLKLTAERGGPPPGAQFVPIPVVPLSAFIGKPFKRPLKGRPHDKPTRHPKPTTPEPPPPVPMPVSQGIPMVSEVSQTVPPLPPSETVVTPVVEIRPDLETVATTPVPTPTTTPNTRDSAPAVYHRFLQNDDGSYYFDFLAANSIARSEQGFLKHDAVLENPILVKTGMYSFTSPEGIPFRVDYVADERGYRTFKRIV